MVLHYFVGKMENDEKTLSNLFPGLHRYVSGEWVGFR